MVYAVVAIFMDEPKPVLVTQTLFSTYTFLSSAFIYNLYLQILLLVASVAFMDHFSMQSLVATLK